MEILNSTNISSFEDVKTFGLSLLDKLDPLYTYHCKEHTLAVSKFIDAYIVNSPTYMSREDKTSISIAATFHDVGFLHTHIHNEGIGVTYALQTTSKVRTDVPTLNRIMNSIYNLIMVTNRLREPINDLEKAILDADMVHLGNKDFLIWNNNLRIELEKLKVVYTDAEWGISQLKFLESHQYYTQYAKRILEPQKKLNVQSFKERYLLA